MRRKFIICFFLLLILLLNSFTSIVKSQPNEIKRFAVLFYDESDAYISLVKKALEEIQQLNHDKVEFIYYDAANNQGVQNQQLELALRDKVDGLLVNIVDYNKSQSLVNRAKENNIPIIFFNREPTTLDSIQSYGKSIFIGTSGCQSGNMQGEMIINQIQNKIVLDRNRNNQLDYVLLKGPRNNKEAIERSRCVIEQINNVGIRTNELYSEFMNWDREITKERLTPVLPGIITDLDVIIANNDQMAIGAIEALQQYGYNLPGGRNYIPVFGIDAIPEAIDLINSGLMEGTVQQDAKSMAEAMYITSMNFAEGKSPLAGTDFAFDSTGVALRIPYPNYIVKPISQ
ncbi:galactose ABC transporter substrate-binding protein [Caproiciproducens sp. MSJ-32]|uniref:galactose ABC transporter substrate-binding protein n=1 Tax=Caproiciproducens sp. MSJ-32 TaxID=2841527 RepID=UPI001C1233EC|nr:galactose ABC transporter substrate-binding protein [Caproiciproducens sp. MSJ-32]MBU5454268.1 galactose ABC transporter substrate-binding protein [Caproiciproducens sp. MSJ-32]